MCLGLGCDCERGHCRYCNFCLLEDAWDAKHNAGLYTLDTHTHTLWDRCKDTHTGLWKAWWQGKAVCVFWSDFLPVWIWNCKSWTLHRFNISFLVLIRFCSALLYCDGAVRRQTRRFEHWTLVCMLMCSQRFVFFRCFLVSWISPAIHLIPQTQFVTFFSRAQLWKCSALARSIFMFAACILSTESKKV